MVTGGGSVLLGMPSVDTWAAGAAQGGKSGQAARRRFRLTFRHLLLLLRRGTGAVLPPLFHMLPQGGK